MRPQKIALILSSVGFHWEEVAAADKVFSAIEGVEVQFFTPNGKTPNADPRSLPPRKILSHVGFGSPPEISPTTEFGIKLWGRIQKAQPVVEMNPQEFTAMYIAGGHGCLFDVNKNPALHARILEMYQSGKTLGAVCHATSTFAFVLQRGIPIVEGKKLTGFPNALDDLLIQLNGVDPQFLPIPFSNDGQLISSQAKNPWEQRMIAILNPGYYVVDRPFITGVGPKAAASVAREMLSSLGSFYK